MSKGPASASDVRRIIQSIPAKQLPETRPKEIQDLLAAEGFDITNSVKVATSTLLKKAKVGMTIEEKPAKEPKEKKPTQLSFPPPETAKLPSVTKLTIKLLSACGGDLKKTRTMLCEMVDILDELIEE